MNRLAAFFMLASLSAVAHGATSTQTFSTTFGPTSVPSAAFDIFLPQFDPSLGTLTNVDLELDATASAGTIAWDNEAPVASDITLGIGAEVTANAPSAIALIAIPLQTGDGAVDADNDGAADFLGADSFAVTGGSGNDTDSASLTNPPNDVSPYIGLSVFATSISSGVETFLSTSGGFGPIDPVPGQFEGTLKVTYTYELPSVPEPTSLVVFSLIGLCCTRLRVR